YLIYTYGGMLLSMRNVHPRIAVHREFHIRTNGLSHSFHPIVVIDRVGRYFPILDLSSYGILQKSIALIRELFRFCAQFVWTVRRRIVVCGTMSQVDRDFIGSPSQKDV